MDIQPPVQPQQIPKEVQVVATLAQTLVPQLQNLQWTKQQYKLLIDIIEDHLGLTGPTPEEIEAISAKVVEEREARIEVTTHGTEIVDRRRKFE
jgi:hypothetical protein